MQNVVCEVQIEVIALTNLSHAYDVEKKMLRIRNRKKYVGHGGRYEFTQVCL